MTRKDLIQAACEAEEQFGVDALEDYAANLQKEVGYAYPTSPDAEELGHGKTGCYTVHLLDPKQPSGNPKVGHASGPSRKSLVRWGFQPTKEGLEEALRHAEGMPQGWSPYSKRRDGTS